MAEGLKRGDLTGAEGPLRQEKQRGSLPDGTLMGEALPQDGTEPCGFHVGSGGPYFGVY